MAKSVAVIGAGPTGRAAARQLAESNVAVTVFDKEAEGGGLMRYGYPEYRMPLTVTKRDVESLKELGVKFRFETSLGQHVTLDELEQQFDAVLVSTGAPQKRQLDVPGEELPGVYHSLEFLYAARSGDPIKPGKRVVVIGGGDTAVDAAVTAKNLGASIVTIAYRGADKLKAQAHEIKRAEGAGIKFRLKAQPQRVKKDGGLTVEFESGPSEPADTIVLAIGQESDSPLLKSMGLTVNDDGSTNRPKVFLAGGTRYGSDRLAKAILDGRTAANRILEQL